MAQHNDETPEQAEQHDRAEHHAQLLAGLANRLGGGTVLPAARVLLSDRQVADRYGVVVRTLERWDLDPAMKFPPPIRINRRRYREVAALEAWERAKLRKAAAQHKSRSRKQQSDKPRVEIR
jgi:hypothetical protein